MILSVNLIYRSIQIAASLLKSCVIVFIEFNFMDDKYQISKSKKPETKQEIIQHQIEELVKRRDKETDLKAKQILNAEITKLFAQYQRLKL